MSCNAEREKAVGACGVGDKIKIKLEPWEKREPEFGSWNRSEFDDEELLTAEPLFGEIVSIK